MWGGTRKSAVLGRHKKGRYDLGRRGGEVQTEDLFVGAGGDGGGWAPRRGAKRLTLLAQKKTGNQDPR